MDEYIYVLETRNCHGRRPERALLLLGHIWTNKISDLLLSTYPTQTGFAFEPILGE